MSDNAAANDGETENKISASERTATGQWLPGHAKRGGRQANTPNYNARSLGQKLGVNPLEIGLEILRCGYVTVPGEQKRLVSVSEYLAMVKEMAKYFAPQLSAVATQISAQVETSQVVDVTALMSDPALARAAQELALGIAAQQPQIEARNPDSYDDSPGNGVRR
jgi:hypothetical protein